MMQALRMLPMQMVLTPGDFPCSSTTHSRKDSFYPESYPQAFSAEMLTGSPCDLLNTFSDSKCHWEISSYLTYCKALLGIRTFILVH